MLVGKDNITCKDQHIRASKIGDAASVFDVVALQEVKIASAIVLSVDFFCLSSFITVF